MADNTACSSRGVQHEWVQYPDQFSRLVFMVNDIKRAETSGCNDPHFNRCFLSGYLPRPEFRSDLIESIYDLPQDFSYLEETSQAEPGSSVGKKASELAPIQLPSFLRLLEELRNGLNEGRIHGSARWDILNLFLNITGARRDTINRVLFYLYPPPGPFVPREKPDGPSALAEARSLYPLEDLAFSLVYRPLSRLERKEYRHYFSIWKEIRQRIENGTFGNAESKESETKMSKALSVSEPLMRMLPGIPWPHLSEGSAAAGAPTRESSTVENGSS